MYGEVFPPKRNFAQGPTLCMERFSLVKGILHREWNNFCYRNFRLCCILFNHHHHHFYYHCYYYLCVLLFNRENNHRYIRINSCSWWVFNHWCSLMLRMQKLISNKVQHVYNVTLPNINHGKDLYYSHNLSLNKYKIVGDYIQMLYIFSIMFCMFA